MLFGTSLVPYGTTFTSPIWTAQNNVGFTNQDLVADKVSNSYGSSSNDVKNQEYNYLEGLFASVGAENQANRQYNSAEAQLNRDFNAREAEKARRFSADEAQLNRLFNAAEAQKNREYQTLMSNTAYTRAMSDMKNAGLNPILMMSKGFSTNNLSGSMAQGSSASSFMASGQNASYNVGGGDTVTDIVNSLANVAKSVGTILNALVPNVNVNFKGGTYSGGV